MSDNCVNHCCCITVNDISSSVKLLKSNKKDGSMNMYTDHIIINLIFSKCISWNLACRCQHQTISPMGKNVSLFEIKYDMQF